MATNASSKLLYAILVIAVVVIGVRLLQPAATRDETSTTGEVGPAPPVAASDIPERLLRVPEALRAYPGIGVDHADHYWYLPYAVLNDAQGRAMLDAIRSLAEADNPLPAQLNVPAGQGAGGGDVLYPTEPGVARFYIADINNPNAVAEAEADIPLLIAHPEPGAESAAVLFLDGHRETVAIGRFPLSPGFLEALRALDPPEHDGEARP